MAATLPEMLASSSKLTQNDTSEYINHLTSLPLDTLLAEPTILQTQSHHLTSSLTSLTHTSYPSFISIHKTTQSLSNSLASLDSSLSALLTDSLPALQTSSSGWRERTDAALKERKKARLVLEQQEKLRDLLDIPLLIDTSVRNGYFAEALSLVAHANSITSSTTTLPPALLASVLVEIRHSVDQMSLTLLGTLHEPNRKIPALWKAVNFLRKMELFGAESAEQQLALVFLSGREACLSSALLACRRDVQSLLSGLTAESDVVMTDRDREDIARYLKKYIDVWREGVHDIVTQFTTIFLERPPSTGPSVPELHSLLTTYTTHAFSDHLVVVLSNLLPHLSTALPSLLTQLTYCATAFARLGMDFRGILSVLFSRAASSSVRIELRRTGKAWAKQIRDAIAGAPLKGRTKSSKVKWTTPSQWLVASTALPDVPEYDASSTPAHIPPPLLASYPPLAELTSAVLTTFNGLRLLAPTGIIHEVDQALDDMLAEAGREYMKYAVECSDAVQKQRWELKDENEGERELDYIKFAGQAYFSAAVPFLRRALMEGVYDTPVSEGGEVLVVAGEWERWHQGTEIDS
jgi:hypothetical protein